MRAIPHFLETEAYEQHWLVLYLFPTFIETYRLNDGSHYKVRRVKIQIKFVLKYLALLPSKYLNFKLENFVTQAYY